MSPLVFGFTLLGAVCGSPLPTATLSMALSDSSSSLTVYHLNPASAGALPVNMDTGDAFGDLYFYLGQFLLPLECKNISQRSRAHFDCDNPERVDPNLVVTRVDMKVDASSIGQYSACNLCNGTDPFTNKPCKKGTYVCDCEHHQGSGVCDPTKVGSENITEHFAPSVPSAKCNETLYSLCGDATSEEHKCFQCLEHNWLKIRLMGHCGQSDLMDFCPSDWDSCRGDHPVAWSCWSENIPRKTGGNWYSTLAEGQNKSWTVTALKTIKERCLQNHLIETVESHDTASCFKGCGARNTSDACWIGCFFDTILGPAARQSKYAPLAGISRSALEQGWTGAFDKCAPVETPLRWTESSAEVPAPMMRLPTLHERLAGLNALGTSPRSTDRKSFQASPTIAADSNGRCEEIFDQHECDGKATGGRKLLGGGGGDCTWCKSADGAHADCFYKSAAKALSKDWICDK